MEVFVVRICVICSSHVFGICEATTPPDHSVHVFAACSSSYGCGDDYMYQIGDLYILLHLCTFAIHKLSCVFFIFSDVCLLFIWM
jgi:hypothetical protein